MSRTTKTGWWSHRRRSKAGADGAHHWRRAGRTLRLLNFERLENRSLLSVTASLSGSTATFSGGSSDDLALMTDSSGNLYYSADGGSFTDDLGGGKTLNLAAQTSTIQVYVGTVLELTNIFTKGQALTIEGPKAQSASSQPKADVLVYGVIDTQGGALSIIQFSNLEVGSSSTVPATISTQNLNGGADYTSGTSSGNSARSRWRSRTPTTSTRSRTWTAVIPRSPSRPAPRFCAGQQWVSAGNGVAHRRQHQLLPRWPQLPHPGRHSPRNGDHARRWVVGDATGRPRGRGHD